MKIYWNEEKSEKLGQERGIDFEEVERIINSDGILHIIPHHNQTKYPHQYIIQIQKGDYIIEIPAVPYLDGYFCKTLYPLSKSNKKIFY